MVSRVVHYYVMMIQRNVQFLNPLR
ncbi:unnamed protein product [Linum tenue]|uniref:Uncharacterized protein n=1 Tax=Linum tenue TaxID=586396 RepID=A0AAV0QBV9_9ROSI|nr:unnamed protein product [Linum tenue]CAI0541732.1 unnamed protein product [Linum tenue]